MKTYQFYLLFLLFFIITCRNKNEVINLKLGAVFTDTTSDIGIFEYVVFNNNSNSNFAKENEMYTGTVNTPNIPELDEYKRIVVECYLKDTEKFIKIDTDSDGILTDEKEILIGKAIPPIAINFYKKGYRDSLATTFYVLPMESQMVKRGSGSALSSIGLKFLVNRRKAFLGLKKNYEITVFATNGKKYSKANSIFIINEINKTNENSLYYQIGDVLYLDKNKVKLSEIDSGGENITIINEGVTSKPIGFLPGTLALDFSGTDLQSGDELYYKEGELTLIEFWGPWCGPCKMITDSIKDLEQKYKNKIKVIGIAVDNSEENVRAYLKQKNIPYPNIYENFAGNNVLSYVIKAYPTFILINKERKIIYRYSGIDQLDTLNKLIKKSL